MEFLLVSMATKEELIVNNTDLAENIEYDIPLRPGQKQLAFDDIAEGFKKWRIWLLLAYHDIKVRYRRSVLGPFWITLSMAITVYSMGYLYAHLFHVDMEHYYPFLVTSMLTWALLSTVIIDLTDTFSNCSGLIKEIKLPYTLYLHRVITRNIIIFFHNMIVMIPIYIIFHQTAKINWCFLLEILSLALMYINALTYGMILAIIGSRYRDISQIIKSLIQVIFFVTPVMWSPSILPEAKRFIVNLNPFYAFLELVRAPLLGQLPTFCNVMVSLAFTFIGILIGLRLFIPYRARIIYWV